MDTQSLTPALQDLVHRFEAGNRPALARCISVVENQRDGYQALLHRLLSRPPRGSRVGLTGPPGAGKSTLVAAMGSAYRERDEEVGIVAVDPTSPYSGGALLGDRIRMNDLALDRGIFIRSMATRGSLGGLATTTKEVVDVMDAFGFPRLLLETVGVGQTELEITAAADTVVVVLVPESGDGIQAMKAGLMEIADIFVINKADRPGADRLLKEIRMALNLRGGHGSADIPAHHGIDYSRVRRSELAGDSAPAGPPDVVVAEESGPEPWKIPVIKTVAQSGEGLEELLSAVGAHGQWLRAGGELERRRLARARDRVRDVVNRQLRNVAWDDPAVLDLIAETEGPVSRGEDTPYAVAARVLDTLFRAK